MFKNPDGGDPRAPMRHQEPFPFETELCKGSILALRKSRHVWLLVVDALVETP